MMHADGLKHRKKMAWVLAEIPAREYSPLLRETAWYDGVKCLRSFSDDWRPEYWCPCCPSNDHRYWYEPIDPAIYWDETLWFE